MLVQQQQLGGDEGRHQQGQRLALAAGKQTYRLAHPVLQAHAQQGQMLPEQFLILFVHPAEERAFRLLGAQVRQGQIFLNGHMGRRSPHGVLKQMADLLAAHMGRQEGNVLPIQHNAAGVRPEAARNGPEQCGLTRAVGTNNGGKISGGQMKAQIV